MYRRVKRISARSLVPVLALGAVLFFMASFAEASHSWGGYHWARTANPFTLKLGDNVGSAWDSYLALASADWSTSSVLHATVVAGNGTRNCQATSGTVQVCNRTYGNTGWLGVANIWVSGSHIVQATVKLNDTYFNTSTYNKPTWRRFVMCQEVGHTFGLDHQDEVFSNPNLGTCMDYTNDPDGTLANPDQLRNDHPNAHDYDELALVYAHLDSFNSFKASAASNPSASPSAIGDVDQNDRKQWGRAVRMSRDGRESLYENVQANGDTVFTFVVWADEGLQQDRGEREDRR